MAEENKDVNEQQQGAVSHFGPIQIDWPRTIGYYGGIGLATAFELIEPPLAIFIAAIPLLKMLNHPGASAPTRFVGELLEGAAKPRRQLVASVSCRRPVNWLIVSRMDDHLRNSKQVFSFRLVL